MSDLLNQLLELPRSEKWQILAILAESLRDEEEEGNGQIPTWQMEEATKALGEIDSGRVNALSNEEFWAAIDAKVEELASRE